MLKVFIGFDSRQPVSYVVAMMSLMKYATVPVSISPLLIGTLPTCRTGLTPFTYSRFLVPFLCNYEGKALFVDADVLFRADVAELFALQGDEAISVVKHPNERRYEWPSVMLFNCEKCKVLTPEFVRTADGLLTSKWTDDIGDLPKAWNHLIGYDEPDPSAKLCHFTQGLPCYKETMNAEHGQEWRDMAILSVSAAPWQELMGNSVHAKHVKKANGESWQDKMTVVGAFADKTPGTNRMMLKAIGVKTNEERQAQINSSLGRGLETVKEMAVHDRPIHIVCYGPSLEDTWQEIDRHADILTISGAHGFLIDRGITPTFHLECDPRNDKIPYITPPHNDVTYLLASVCHPEMFDHLKDHKVKLWHVHNDKTDHEVIWQKDKEAIIVKGGSTAGLSALALAYAMGYRDIHVHAMDSSNKNEVQRHAGPHYGKFQKPMRATFDNKRWFVTTGQMVCAMDEFFMMHPLLAGANITLHGDGMLQEKARLMQKVMPQKLDEMRKAGNLTDSMLSDLKFNVRLYESPSLAAA